MNTYQRLTTYTPDLSRPVNFYGTLREWWRSPHGGHPVMVSRFTLATDADDIPEIRVRVPAVVMFNGEPDGHQTHVIVWKLDHMGTDPIAEGYYADDETEVVRVVGHVCHATQESRLLTPLEVG